MSQIAITAISVLGTVCAIVFGYATFQRNRKKDDMDEGMLLTELGYIKSGIDDIKRKQEQQEQRHIEIISRLAVVEASAKQAHHRIDELIDRGA